MTAKQVYKIDPDESGWRKLANGNYVMLTNLVTLGNGVTLEHNVWLRHPACTLVDTRCAVRDDAVRIEADYRTLAYTSPEHAMRQGP
jgi:hypothetical protein